MPVQAVFGLSVLLSLVAFGIVAMVYVAPKLRLKDREDALLLLVIPHLFRFVGLSFLVPGVVSSSPSPAFAALAAYGDLIATLLAILATFALVTRASWAIGIVGYLTYGAQAIFCMRSTPGSSALAEIPACSVQHSLFRHLVCRYFWLRI